MKNALVLAVDVGGTTTRVALVERDVKGKLAVSARKEWPTGTRGNLTQQLLAFTKEHEGKGRPTVLAVAVAGPVSMHKGYRRVKMTNNKLVINEQQLLEKTRFPTVRVYNDFEALGYAPNVLEGKDLSWLRKGRAVRERPILILGPGTGLGVALSIPNGEGWYEGVQSEVSRVDFPAVTPEEFALVAFTRHVAKKGDDIGRLDWEELLSGRGLEHVYQFLRLTTFHDTKLPSALTAEAISTSVAKNPCSKATTRFFSTLLARLARNTALTTCSWGGLWLAGGVAVKNKEWFGKEFVSVFDDHDHPQYAALLEKTPLAVITNKEATLLSVAVAALHDEGS